MTTAKRNSNVSKNTNEKRGAKNMNKSTATKEKKVSLPKIELITTLSKAGKTIPAVANVPYVDDKGFMLLADKAHQLYGVFSKGVWKFRQTGKKDAQEFKRFVEEQLRAGNLKMVEKPKRASKRSSGVKVVSGEVETLTERVDKLESTMDKVLKVTENICKRLDTITKAIPAPKPAKRITSK